MTEKLKSTGEPERLDQKPKPKPKVVTATDPDEVRIQYLDTGGMAKVSRQVAIDLVRLGRAKYV